MSSQFFQFPWISNGYVYRDNLSAYIRITTRNIRGVGTRTIEIGNVEVSENAQNRGIFSKFLREVEDFADENDRVVMVENVHNELLRAFLERKGYTLLDRNYTYIRL